MKIYNYLIFIFILSISDICVTAQTVIQANWPNADWSIRGSYTSNGIISAPTDNSNHSSLDNISITPSENFGFDDNLADLSSLDDYITVESPRIDLRNAVDLGQNQLVVTFDYIYLQSGDILNLEWYDTTTHQWNVWETIDGNSYGEQNYDYVSCIEKQLFTSTPKDISNFTPSQLAGFKYRISFNDNGYTFGFCMGSPTLKVTTTEYCFSPVNFTVVRETSNSLSLNWDAYGNNTESRSWKLEYFPIDNPSLITTIENITTNGTHTISNINTELDYEFKLFSKCGGVLNEDSTIYNYVSTNRCEAPEFTSINYNPETQEVTIVLTNASSLTTDSWHLEYGEFGYQPNTNETIASYEYTPTVNEEFLTVTIRLDRPYTNLEFEYLDFYVRSKCGNTFGKWESNYKLKIKFRFLLYCNSSNSVKIKYTSHTQPISSFRVVYALSEIGLSIDSDGAYHPAGADIHEVAMQGGLTGEMIIDNLESATYDFYLIRYENDDFQHVSDKETINLKICSDEEECQPPTNIQATNSTSSEIYLSWSDNNSVSTTDWQIEYGLHGFTEGTGYVINNITNTNYVLTGLDELAMYDIYISSNCGVLSTATLASFTTEMQICAIPANVQAESTDTTVYLSWLNGNIPPEPIGGWEIEYNFSTYTQGTGGTIVTADTNEILIENLVPSNSYDFFIRAKCGSNNSDWIGPITINTKCANCTSFKPEKNKEYILSTWVKEEHSKITEVALTNDNQLDIKELLKALVARYIAGIGIPNGYYNTSIANLLSAFQPELIAQANTLNTENPAIGGVGNNPGIYNFIYNEEDEEFQFQFVKGEFEWTENVLTNPGAEYTPGTTEWIVKPYINPDFNITTYGKFETIVNTGEGCGLTLLPPNSGNQYFCVGGVCQQTSIHGSYNQAKVAQNIDVNNYADLIDNGDCKVKFGGFVYRVLQSIHQGINRTDIQRIRVSFLDVDDNRLSYREIGNNHTPESLVGGVWKGYDSDEISIPPKTRKIEMMLIGVRWNNINNEGLRPNYSFFDDVYLQIGSYKNNKNVDIQTFSVNCTADDYGIITTAVDPDSHYPEKNNHYNLIYDCNGTSQDGVYSYGRNTYKTTTTITPLPLTTQVSTYNNVYVQLTFFDNQNNIVPDFTGQPNRTIKTNPNENIIDGWQRIQDKFKVPIGTVKIKIDLVNDHNNDAFFDDVRIFPIDGNMKSFVYDQVTQKLMAELDENNYATFYEYDNEGGLIRVKKETEKGVFTIQETRSGNYKKE